MFEITKMQNIANYDFCDGGFKFRITENYSYEISHEPVQDERVHLRIASGKQNLQPLVESLVLSDLSLDLLGLALGLLE